MVRLSQGREGGMPDEVAQIIDRIDLEAEEEDGEARRSECPPATAPTSPTAVGGSGVEDALRAENACHKRLRVLDRELQDLVAGLCRDYGALEGRREPLDDVSYWSFVHGTAKALDAVEKDFDLKGRIVARTDYWRTPEEDTFVYGALSCPWSLSCARGTLRGRGGGLGRARQAREAKRTPSSLFLGNCCTHTNFIVVLHRPATCPARALTSSRAWVGGKPIRFSPSSHPASQLGGRETRAWGRTTKRKAKKNVHRGRLHVGRRDVPKDVAKAFEHESRTLKDSNLRSINEITCCKICELEKTQVAAQS